MISTRAHAITDYAFPLGVALLGATGWFGGPIRRLMRIGPVWHLGYSVLTRHEGGLLPVLGRRAHLACDTVGALAFLGAGVLAREQKASHRLLMAAMGLAELALVAATEERPRGRG